MTLPIQKTLLCGGGGGVAAAADPINTIVRRGPSSTNSTSSSGSVSVGRRRLCRSVAWPDPPTHRERRRAICSWSIGYGYGTLTELDEDKLNDSCRIYDKEKVADNAALLETCGRRPPNSIALPHGLSSSSPNPTPNLAAAVATAVAAAPPPSTTTAGRRPRNRVDLLTMPGLRTLVQRRRHSGAGVGTPLVERRRDENRVRPAASLASLRKCETVLALTGLLRTPSVSSTASSADDGVNNVEPLRPINRLRTSPAESTTRMCSRCSSLLTLASTSRYSLSSTTGGFVPVTNSTITTGTTLATDVRPTASAVLLCKLCLVEVPSANAYRIQQCDCSFCVECMRAYVEFEIAEGAYDISCPDAQCMAQGVLDQDEIKRLAGNELLEKHIKYRLNREVELDKNRTWCPRAGCETVCTLCPSQRCNPQSVRCPTCTTDFCSNCKLEWHESMTCDAYGKQLAKEGKIEDVGIPFDSDLIKCCPMCNVPIEKDEGCAQMMCKRCKHVFCWYCLASLDDDYLLRHYDKGPCKNKLGHSRASVIWHRTQVIGIFAGFGILLLVASPLLLLAAPCIVCCKCRVCNAGNTKLDNEDDVPSEGS